MAGLPSWRIQSRVIRSVPGNSCQHPRCCGNDDGALLVLAKFDLESAYHMVPVHPQDRLLLGMVWKGQRYADGALPFGHSFRIGAVTTAVVKGMEDCIIKILGRWESLAYLQYVRLPWEQMAGYSSLLAL